MLPVSARQRRRTRLVNLSLFVRRSAPPSRCACLPSTRPRGNNGYHPANRKDRIRDYLLARQKVEFVVGLAAVSAKIGEWQARRLVSRRSTQIGFLAPRRHSSRCDGETRRSNPSRASGQDEDHCGWLSSSVYAVPQRRLGSPSLTDSSSRSNGLADVPVRSLAVHRHEFRHAPALASATRRYSVAGVHVSPALRGGRADIAQG